MKALKISALAAVALIMNDSAYAQVTSKNQLSGQQNVITTSVPFLTITPDARHAGMGDAGTATSPDAYSLHFNAAKLAFIERKGGMSISYTPWLRQLVPDVSLSYLTGYGRIDDKSAFSGSLRYFSLGNIAFTDDFGASLGNFNPYEFAIDGAYARKLSENFSVGVALRFIYSNLAGNLPIPGGSTTKPGVSGAGDVSAYYTKDTKVAGKKAVYSFGGIISNLGAKVTYTTSVNRDFIPAMLRLGGYYKMDIDQYNTIAITADINKLLVPTQPIYYVNAQGDDSIANGKRVIQYGKDPNVGVIAGAFQSFGDAPGGFKEEMKEINVMGGLEYWYDKQFAARMGYFREPSTKGNRQYLTFGAGLRYNVFGLDFAYLVPIQQRHPLENTLRFSLHFDFDAFKKQ